MLAEAEDFRRGRALGNDPGTLGRLDRPSADQLVDEIARRRRAVAHPLFLASFTFFLLTLLALAYLPDLVAYRVYGAFNVAYLLALTQFVATFVVAAVYARWAQVSIDPLTAEACEILGRPAAEART